MSLYQIMSVKNVQVNRFLSMYLKNLSNTTNINKPIRMSRRELERNINLPDDT
jgi:hypothetical protein